MLVTALVQLLLLLAVAHLLFGVALPDDATHWLRFVWVFLLSVLMATVLGIGISGHPPQRALRQRRDRADPARAAVRVRRLLHVHGPPGVAAERGEHLPRQVGRSGHALVFLPDRFAAVEQHGTWDLGTTALVLLAWTILGLVAARISFRWVRKDG